MQNAVKVQEASHNQQFWTLTAFGSCCWAAVISMTTISVANQPGKTCSLPWHNLCIISITASHIMKSNTWLHFAMDQMLVFHQENCKVICCLLCDQMISNDCTCHHGNVCLHGQSPLFSMATLFTSMTDIGNVLEIPLPGHGFHAGHIVKYHGKFATEMWFCFTIKWRSHHKRVFVHVKNM